MRNRLVAVSLLGCGVIPAVTAAFSSLASMTTKPTLTLSATTGTTRQQRLLHSFPVTGIISQRYHCVHSQQQQKQLNAMFINNRRTGRQSSIGRLRATPNPNDDTTDVPQLGVGTSTLLSSSTTTLTPRVYPQRWTQLAYLSLLALLSDWICFSVAAAPDTYEAVYQHSAASLIDLFLFTNVASSFLVTDIVAKIGLQSAIQGSAILMTIGCWLRSGLEFLPFVGDPHTNALVSYPLLVFGTLCVGAAQPFFQCTPPMLSATWFAPTERATSTAVALNFNQIGIATAFLVGGAMAVDRTGLSNYFGLIAVLCTVVTTGTLLQFQNEPPVPPSLSELEKKNKGEKEPPFFDSARRFFRKPGFTPALAAFVCSISVTNIVGTFIDEIMERGGITEQLSIDLAGASFELAILVGGILIGGYVDRTKQYKRVTLTCLALTALFVLPLGLTEHSLGQEPLLLLLALMGLGLAAGPIQPINAELAVDVTYPCDETAVESVQQVGGNMISALLIPVAEWASHADLQLLPNIPMLASDVRGDVILLLVVTLMTMVYFNTFDAPLERTMADSDGHQVTEQQEEVSARVVEADAIVRAGTIIEQITSS